MPRGDGTGPAGLGPMTGRAAGYCAGYSVPGYANPVSGRGGFGRGSWGGGRGRRNWYYATGLPGWVRAYRGYPAWGGMQPPDIPYQYAPPTVNPEQELEMLRNQAKQMQEDMKFVTERIKELEKHAAQSKEQTKK